MLGERLIPKLAAVILGLLDLGETRWLRKKVDAENEKVGRLI